MNSKKRTLILSFIVFALILFGIGTVTQAEAANAESTFYYGAVKNGTFNVPSDLGFKTPLNVRSVSSTTASIINASAKPEVVSIKGLYNIYVSSKWKRIISNENTDYLAAQFVALNTAGSNINKYSASVLGTTKVATPIKTGPGVYYSSVLQLPLGKTLELLGEITNPAGEKWLMYKYTYAVYYVATSDVEIIVPLAPPINPTPITTAKTTKTSVPPPPPPPPVASSENAQKIISLAYSKLGSAYVYGAVGPNTFDCSGFVYWVVNNSGIPGLSIPRNSQTLYEQFKSYSVGTSIANAKPGDIILFSTNGTASGISHSAIYYKYDTLIHSSTPSTGVILTSVAYSTTNKSIFAIIRLPGC